MTASILFGMIYWLGKGRMGAGDLKLMGARCLYLNLQEAIFAVLLTAVAGAVVAVIVMLASSQRNTFSYGPVIACSTVMTH